MDGYRYLYGNRVEVCMEKVSRFVWDLSMVVWHNEGESASSRMHSLLYTSPLMMLTSLMISIRETTTAGTTPVDVL